MLWIPRTRNFGVRLDLFKKTSPSFSQTGMGFLQKSAKSSNVLRAKGMLVSLAQVSRSHQTQLSLIASALKSKSVDFSKITEQIDGTRAGIALAASDMLAAVVGERGYLAIVGSVVALHALLGSRGHGSPDPILFCRWCESEHAHCRHGGRAWQGAGR